MKSRTIVHFRNGIGNFVSFTPALQALASMDTSGKVDMCIEKDWMDSRKGGLFELWDSYPFINKTISFDEIVQKGKDYKTWFWSSWSTHGEPKEYFSSKHFYSDKGWDQTEVHESEYYMNLVREWYGYTGQTPKQFIPVATRPVINTHKKIIVLSNGGFGYLIPLKKYSRFKDLAKCLRDWFGETVHIVKIGYGSELSDVDIYDEDYVWKLSITETAKVIQQATLVITNDTGNMHVADALNVPQIVLWGGSVVEKNQPINGNNKIIHLGLPCQPCQPQGGYRNCANSACMNDIQVGEIMFHVRKFFHEGKFK